MRCSRVQYLYEEYAAGLLPPQTAARVDEHLALCRECRDYFESNDDISEILSRGAPVAHPGEVYLEGLSSRVMGNLFDDSGQFKKVDLPPEPEEAIEARSAFGRPLWWAGGMAAAGLVVLGLGPVVADYGGLDFPSLQPKANLAASAPAPAPISAPAESRVLPGIPVAPPELRRDLTMVSAAPGGVPLAGVQKSAKHREEMERRQNGQPPREAAGRNAGTLVVSIDGAVEQAMKRGIEPSVLEEIIVLQSIGTAEANERVLWMLERMATTLGDGANAAPGQEPLAVRQSRLYFEARDLYRMGQLERALDGYLRAIDMAPGSKLALRAGLGAAGVYYDLARFSEAHGAYRQLAAKVSSSVFSKEEIGEIQLRAHLLEKYAPAEFAPLALLYRANSAPWPEALAAVNQLAADPLGRDLVHDAAAALLERLQTQSNPGDHAVMELIAIGERALPEQADSRAKAWLQMTLGDLYWVQFQNADQAFCAYEKVLEIDRNSPAAEAAEKKLRQLRSQNLLHPQPK